MGITGSKSTESLDGEGPSTYEQRDDYAFAGDAGQETQIPTITQEELASTDPENKIPMVFRWNHPAQDVWVAGTFTDWQKVRMHRSGNDFSYITDVPKGKHAYRFFVNDQWQCASDQPPVRMDDGELYNLVDLTNFVSLEEEYMATVNREREEEQYTAVIPTFEDGFMYSTEPPHLPPHLRKIILNQSSSQPSSSSSGGGGGGGAAASGRSDAMREDATELAQANHVTLNHLYCTAMKHGLMVLGTTFRYKQKCVTTVYYSVATNMTARQQS